LLETLNFFVLLSKQKYAVGPLLGTEDGSALGTELGIGLGKELGITLRLGTSDGIDDGTSDRHESQVILHNLFNSSFCLHFFSMYFSSFNFNSAQVRNSFLELETNIFFV